MAPSSASLQHPSHWEQHHHETQQQALILKQMIEAIVRIGVSKVSHVQAYTNV